MEALAQAACSYSAAAGPQRPASHSADAWALLLASPYAALHERALSELAGLVQPDPSSRSPAAPSPPAAAWLPASSAHVATALAALLLRHGHAARLAAAGSPLLAELVGVLPAGPLPASAQAGDRAGLGGAVLPALAVELIEAQQAPLAAGLVARRLRLHPALATAGDCALVLDRYLRAVAASAGDDASMLGGGAAASGQDLQDTAQWPGAVAVLGKECGARARRALEFLHHERASSAADASRASAAGAAVRAGAAG